MDDKFLTPHGQLFYSNVKYMDELPDFEIGEVKLFDNIPENLTYPLIQSQKIRCYRESSDLATSRTKRRQ